LIADSFERHHMKLRRSHKIIFSFIALIALMALTPLARSQPSPVPAEGPADAKKSAPAPRLKPQVIYHLPKTSSDAAALHAQAKAENSQLSIDSNMPTSLQMARSNANAAAAQPTSPTPNAQSPVTQPRNRKHRPEQRAKLRTPAGTRPIRTTPAKAPGPKHGNEH
jgi:hypothetical protein